MVKKITGVLGERKINSWLIFFFLVYLILIVKLVTISQIYDNFIFGAYSLSISLYLLSRFFLSYFYEPEFPQLDDGSLPTVSFAVPSKNEGENIRKTILLIADSDYPKDKFNVIAVNDGSTDNTLEEMLEAKKIAERNGVEVEVVDWKVNKGKREGMAECVRRSDNEIIVFIDSDSFVEKNTVRELVKYFTDEKVAAVAGHAYVANAETNMLTKMQSVRYFVAFKAYKAAEALFNSVTCCSGCCSAYRKKYVEEVLDKWQNQMFLGVRCTYGDDRSLTNFLLAKGYKAMFAPSAISYTIVPDNFKQYLKQQLRWKKSWFRESLKAGMYIWKRNPIMSFSFYAGFILPIISPLVVIRALIWYPIATGLMPWFYISGLLLMGVTYGFYYYIYTKDKKWFYGMLFSILYSFLLIWQLPWAILNIRDPKWGTR